jgi:hypothetical protein
MKPGSEAIYSKALGARNERGFAGSVLSQNFVENFKQDNSANSSSILTAGN